jgi:hypothetical protein
MSDNQASSSYLSELNKTKYIDMKSEFEKRFKMNGFKPDSFFNSKIWFLKNDQQFQQLIHNQTPFSSPSNQNKIIIDLLSELNQGPDLKNLKVQTDQFISRLCEIIINSYISIQISDNTIKKNNSHQKLSKINEILNLLNMRVQGRRKGDKRREARQSYVGDELVHEATAPSFQNPARLPSDEGVARYAEVRG